MPDIENLPFHLRNMIKCEEIPCYSVPDMQKSPFGSAFKQHQTPFAYSFVSEVVYQQVHTHSRTHAEYCGEAKGHGIFAFEKNLLCLILGNSIKAHRVHPGIF